MTDTGKGVAAMVLACVVWGLSPLYYKLLVHIPPLEILAHRTLWSFVIFAVVLLVQGRIGALPKALARFRDGVVLAVASLMIAINWFIFISAVQIERAMEAALGYYIFPLASVLFGALFFRERLGRAQNLSVVLATLAVVVLTLGLGTPPWIALIIALSFGLYGVIKKTLDLGPVVSVTAEVLLLTPVALAVLWQVHQAGDGAFAASLSDTLLLIGSGPMTAVPLMLFSYGARRITLASTGLIHYLNPTLQFLVATLVFRELFSLWHAIAFALIWAALALYTTAAWRQERAARRLVRSS